MDNSKPLPRMICIKDLRKELKIPQVELARLTGIPQQTISRMERKDGDVSYSKVRKVLNFLLMQNKE